MAARPPRDWPTEREGAGKPVVLELALQAIAALRQRAAARSCWFAAPRPSPASNCAPSPQDVGENEKRIDALFARAEEIDVSLFFDEADALFGECAENGEDKPSERDDMIVLDPAAGRWLGQVYLEARGGIRNGIYSLRGLYNGYRAAGVVAFVCVAASAFALRFG